MSINELNVAAVTLQENNHVALVHLPTGTVIHDFPAGTGDPRPASTPRRTASSSPTAQLVGQSARAGRRGLARPPAPGHRQRGRPVRRHARLHRVRRQRPRRSFDAGHSARELAQRHGHYPEDRSENKGTEPEGVVAARFQGRDLVFVGSERGNFVAVYEDARLLPPPRFLQLLPTGVGPEGLLAIPQRGLFVAAAETDDDPVRSQITIFRLRPQDAELPAGRVGPAPRRAPGRPRAHRLGGPLRPGRRPAATPQRLYTAHDAFLRRVAPLRDGRGRRARGHPRRDPAAPGRRAGGLRPRGPRPAARAAASGPSPKAPATPPARRAPTCSSRWRRTAPC